MANNCPIWKDRCYRCHKEGHTSNTCTLPDKRRTTIANDNRDLASALATITRELQEIKAKLRPNWAWRTLRPFRERAAAHQPRKPPEGPKPPEAPQPQPLEPSQPPEEKKPTEPPQQAQLMNSNPQRKKCGENHKASPPSKLAPWELALENLRKKTSGTNHKAATSTTNAQHNAAPPSDDDADEPSPTLVPLQRDKDHDNDVDEPSPTQSEIDREAQWNDSHWDADDWNDNI